MARNKYPGRCYCCREWIEPGYGHFEKVHNPAPGESKWRIKCVKCTSGRVLTDKGPGVIRARKATKEVRT